MSVIIIIIIIIIIYYFLVQYLVLYNLLVDY